MDSPKTSNDAQQQKKRNSNRRSRNNQTKNNGSAAQPLNQKSKPSADPKSKGHCSQQTTDKKNADGEKMNNNRHQSGRTSQKKNEEGDRRNFPDYYRPDVVQHALEKNVLFSGILRIHQVKVKVLVFKITKLHTLQNKYHQLGVFFIIITISEKLQRSLYFNAKWRRRFSHSRCL